MFHITSYNKRCTFTTTIVSNLGYWTVLHEAEKNCKVDIKSVEVILRNYRDPANVDKAYPVGQKSSWMLYKDLGGALGLVYPNYLWDNNALANFANLPAEQILFSSEIANDQTSCVPTGTLTEFPDDELVFALDSTSVAAAPEGVGEITTTGLITRGLINFNLALDQLMFGKGVTHREHHPGVFELNQGDVIYLTGIFENFLKLDGVTLYDTFSKIDFHITYDVYE